MFLITNRSGKEIVVADLGLSISPKQAFDLDAMKLKINPPDKSKDLQICIKRGWIKVLKSDRKKKRKQVKEQNEVSHSIDKKMLDAIRDTLRDEIKQQIGAITQSQPQHTKIDQVLSSLTQLIKQGKPLTNEVIKEVVVEQNQITQDEQVSIDEDTLSEIHARAVNRITQGIEGEIEYKHQQIKSDISNQVSELEDLIG